jgi:hypothetical protein
VAVQFRPGDCVIYRKAKLSAHPGRHAQDIRPAPNGDSYSYCVSKFYRVISVLPQEVVVGTRRGRQRTLAEDDPALRRAYWWERLLLGGRFPPLTPA